jgi:hypothetical protein
MPINSLETGTMSFYFFNSYLIHVPIHHEHLEYPQSRQTSHPSSNTNLP